ncbi:carbon-nitrogen hydrolase family protein [Arthrobacter sp. H-02-3]|uniref:carbon-nitrogen hydrolase family protein n=1 Tax=Arthrobacter sp. H-02-3 TaxID=2703675 RepID=UPI000DD272D9|nr:carbon-nitrogen hydrolase family protein [Arthrobacter sp. H-02-3]PVZ54499.1 carbon-nitrogen hydrolase family protein [Arthrobacter sp. H-02-3]
MTTGSITALTLSAIQYEALDGGVAANVPEHIRLIEDAESHGARLVIFPELSLTGYRLDLLEGPEEWLSTADRRLDGIREICRRTGITAVVGAAFTQDDGTPRLASLAIHPSGAIEPSFKTWLHGPEQGIFVAGSHPAVLEIDGWKIALAICFDAARPGHAEWAAGAGADVYAVSAVYTAGEDHRLGLHLGARAMDNRMFSVLANLAGTTPLGPSCGLSGFWGPDGLPFRQAAGTGTEVLTASLQHSVLARFRRP